MKASEAYLCRERTLKNALFDKRNFEYEQPQTDKRLQTQTAKRRRKTTAWTITENVTSKMAAVTSRTQAQCSTISHGSETRYAEQIRPWDPKYPKKYGKKRFFG